MFSPTSPRRSSSSRRARLATLATGLVLVAAPVIGIADGASATDEFPAKPEAIMTFECGAKGGSVMVHTFNVGGLSGVTLTINFTGRPDAIVSLNAGQSATDAFYGLADNGVYVVTVSAPTGWSATATFDYVNCFEFFGDISTHCLGEIPYVTGQANAALRPDVVNFELDGVTESVEVDNTHVFTEQLVNGVPFSASMSNDADGEFAHLDGVADCSTPIPATTIPTIPDSTPETPITVTQEGETPTTTPAPLVVAEAPVVPPARSLGTQLPATGTNNTVIAIVAITILGIGVSLRRLASRSPR